MFDVLARRRRRRRITTDDYDKITTRTREYCYFAYMDELFFHRKYNIIINNDTYYVTNDP